MFFLDLIRTFLVLLQSLSKRMHFLYKQKYSDCFFFLSSLIRLVLIVWGLWINIWPFLFIFLRTNFANQKPFLVRSCCFVGTFEPLSRFWCFWIWFRHSYGVIFLLNGFWGWFLSRCLCPELMYFDFILNLVWDKIK